MLSDNARALARLQYLIEHMMMGPHLPDMAESQAWSRAGYPIISQGQSVLFGEAHDSLPYLAGGWWIPEAWGIWGIASPQTIRFALGADYRGGYVNVRVTMQGYAPANMDRPHVDICANGFFLGTYALRGTPQPIKLRLPPACIGDGNILLHMSLHDTYSPASVGDGHDGRQLGVGLVALAID